MIPKMSIFLLMIMFYSACMVRRDMRQEPGVLIQEPRLINLFVKVGFEINDFTKTAREEFSFLSLSSVNHRYRSIAQPNWNKELI